MELIIDSNFDSKNNNWLIKMIGEVDLFNSSEMKSKLLEIFDSNHASMIIFCEELDYLDSTALGALVSVLKHTKQFDCTISLKNIKPNIEKLFKITNLDQVFKIEGDDK